MKDKQAVGAVGVLEHRSPATNAGRAARHAQGASPRAGADGDVATGDTPPGVMARVMYGVVLLVLFKIVSVVLASVAMDLGWLSRQSISRHLFHPLAFLLVIVGGYQLAPRLWPWLPLWGLRVARPADPRAVRGYLLRVGALTIAGTLLLWLSWRGLDAAGLA